MNHAESLGAKQLFTPLRFRCQQVFSFRESFFSRPRRGNLLARRRRMSHFQTRVKNFFAIRENLLPRRPCGHGQFVGANGFMRLFDHTVKHFPAKNFAFLPAAGATFPRMPEGHARIPASPFAAFLFFVRQCQRSRCAGEQNTACLSSLRTKAGRPSRCAESKNMASFSAREASSPQASSPSAHPARLSAAVRQQKREPEGPPGHATSASCPTRHNFPAAPRDGDGPSPAFPYPRTGGPDGASSGRRSGRSCPPARPR